MVDMWAFGCTFYEVLHIKPMFSGPYLRLMTKIASGQLSPFEAECPAEFKDAILQCFEANPTNRPDPLSFIQTVETVKFELEKSSLLQRYANY